MSHVSGGRMLIAGILTLSTLAAVNAASAHPGGAQGDGRIPGQPDFERIGEAEVRFHPGSRSYSFRTGPGAHVQRFHVDPKADIPEGQAAMPATEEPVVCASSGHRIKIAFSSAATSTPTADQAGRIRTVVRRMGSKLLNQSLISSGNARGLRLRVDCDSSGEIRILGYRSGGGWQETLQWPGTLWGEPTGAESVKYLTFYAGSDPDGRAGGYGLGFDDDDKSSSDSTSPFVTHNANRVQTSHAVVYEGAWTTHAPLHELFHAFGAVIPGAPYSTPGSHCVDGYDLMCYDDDTSYWWYGTYSVSRCPASGLFHTDKGLPIDCMYDSYFDAMEESGEWLSDHWNTGGVENPFLMSTPAAAAPSVTARPASSSTPTNVTLSGAITPNGLPTEYRFEYGPTAAYGSRAPIPNAALGSNLFSSQPVSLTIPSLQPGTTYHYRLAAINAIGTRASADQTFITPSWGIAATPNPAGASGSYLHSVGCEPASTDLCTAVGSSTISGVDAPLALRWDGASWAAQAPQQKSGAVHTRLLGVDCPSTSRCVAVGNYENAGSGPTTLAQLWNSGSWSIQPTPVPSGAISSELTDVGCNSTANCTAVGSAVINGVRTAIAAKWTSPTWAAEAIPIPAGATSSQLDGVDCLWSNFCVAVGRYTASSGTRAFAVFWNGTNWSLQSLPEPAGATQSTLLDVACSSSPNACTAAGGWKNSAGNQHTLAYRFTNGSTWTHQSTPNPAGSVASVLQDVSCATATSCAAVGSWVSGSGGSNRTLAETWDGASWSLQGTADPVGASFSAFFSASCRGTGCVGVGWSTGASGVDTTLAEIR